MKKAFSIRGLLFAGVLVGLAVAEVGALPPPRPGLVDPLTKRFWTTGQPFPAFPKEVREYRRHAPLNGKYPLSPRPVTTKSAPGRTLAVDPFADNAVRPLVLLIDFNDRPASPTVASKATFAGLFFGAGPSDLSVRNYWNEVSYGRFAVNGSSADINPGTSTPTGWLRAGVDFPSSITSSLQIADVQPGNVRTLIDNAVAFLAGLGVNFSPYVRASDNTFHMVILVHPTYGAEDSGDLAFDPYSHTAGIAPVTTPQGNIVDYTIVPSLQFYSDPTPGGSTADDPLIGIGVIVHEMGHLLGLPDLYPTAAFGQVGADFTGAGVFDLMAYGMWGANLVPAGSNVPGPAVPAHLSAWSKSFLGWLSPRPVTATSVRTLRPAEQFPDADQVLSNTIADPGQYFLVENRQTGGPWLFDKLLVQGTGGGSGVLIWQINDNVIQANLAANTVNSDPAFRGVFVKEADGVDDLSAAIVGPDPNTRAKFFGLGTDFFVPGKVFDRTNPSATVNSSPVIDDTFHPIDFLSQVSMFDFTSPAADLSVDYVVSIAGPTGGGASWRTFNVASTQPPGFPAPMRSDDILSLAFDSGNNVWMGSRGQGIFRFLGTSFEFLTTQRGLPSGTGTAPVAAIQAMAFEPATGSMWVGTDQGLFKMRDAGQGFRVQSSFTTASPVPRTLPGSNAVQTIAVRKGSDIKYAGTPAGLVRIVDGLTDADADDFASVIIAGNVTAIAIDDNGNTDIRDDVVWAGFSDGRLIRSLVPGQDGGPADGDPVLPSHFKTYNLLGAPNVRISSLAVDKTGLLWIGTGGDLEQNRRGIQVFDLGEHLGLEDFRDPFDFNGDGDRTAEAYLNFTVVADDNNVRASNNITGIGFQATSQAAAIAWMSHRADNSFPGGASRFDANLANDNTTLNRDERLAVFRPIPPSGEDPFGSTTSVAAAAGDAAGNVWFASTDRGVLRFGNAGVLSLDKANYVNVTAIARVTLQDDGLNTDPGIPDLAIVRVTSGSDTSGFFMVLSETGNDTGVFQGSFGFTNGPSDSGGSPQLIQVQNGNKVTVTYVDFNPAGVRTAEATWRRVFPFEDNLLIEGGACFIATAAYGSPMAREVETLRRFRDEYLVSSRAGRISVRIYYRLSPLIAPVIADRPALRSFARAALVPAAGIAAFAVETGPAEKTAVFLVCLGFAAALFLRSGRKGRRSS